MFQHNTVDPQAQFIWNDNHGRGSNRYVIFRKTFALAEEPASGRICIFADTRYRLTVNGQTLCHGPARFYLSQPEYDVVDIRQLLRRGRNAITVTVNSCGAASFQSESSVGGLIAWGEIVDKAGKATRLATDPTWKAVESPGHDPHALPLSFALHAGEFLDARLIPAGWDAPDFDDSKWPNAVAHGNPEHWGPLQPRSIALLDESVIQPASCTGAWVGRDPVDEDIYSLVLTDPKAAAGNLVAVLTYIYSPQEQEVTLGAWWGRYWINSEPADVSQRQDIAYRQDLRVRLHRGWNLLQVWETILASRWDFYLGVPKSAGLSLSAEQVINSPHVFLIGGPWPGRSLAACQPLTEPGALPANMGPWQKWPREKIAAAPIRERAWKTFEKISDGPEVRVDVAPLVSRVGDGALSLVFDFGAEVLGRPVIDFRAAEGTIIDLGYTERLKSDGLADINYRLFVDMMERYISRDGRQRWHTFHPRGMRYLEVLVQGDLSKFELLNVSLTKAMYPAPDIGSFECSDPILGEIWKLGRATLHACMEDAYLDCPHRERGLYVGDMLVQYLSNLAAFGDRHLLRRCIEVFMLGQIENGLLRTGAHGLEPGRHPDYSALIPHILWQYWATSGDVEFLRKMHPRLKKLVEAFEIYREPGTDLIDGSNYVPYIDLSRLDTGGVNCAMNCFFHRGFADAGRIFELLADTRGAAHCFDRAEKIKAAIQKEFWDESRGVFVDRRSSDVPHREPSVPANALALLFGIATPQQAASASKWMGDAMMNNFRVPDPVLNADCNVTSYFSYYAIGALYAHGLSDVAIQFMRKYWSRYIEAGAWTLWEYFAEVQGASRCHAWSSAPTHYLSTEVLGVHFPQPGDLTKVRISPKTDGLTWAKGVYPHPAGPIHVKWEIKNGRTLVETAGPPGVDIQVH